MQVVGGGPAQAACAPAKDWSYWVSSISGSEEEPAVAGWMTAVATMARTRAAWTFIGPLIRKRLQSHFRASPGDAAAQRRRRDAPHGRLGIQGCTGMEDGWTERNPPSSSSFHP